MSKSSDIIARDRKVISPSLTRELPFVFQKGSGCHLWDVDGKRYLDFTACIAVSSIGHDSPVIRKAMLRQIKYGIHAAFSDFYAETPVRLAETLLGLMPGFQKVFLCNSGTESVEAAYKLARWHSDRTWVIAFQGAFHGRTMGALSMTNSKPVQRGRFGPFLPVVHTPYPYAFRMGMEPEECAQHCLGLLEDRMNTMRGDLAAVFLEPIQGEGGYVVPPASFVKGVRKLCNEYGALLCDDEVQAGCFRTGKFLAIENFGVKPDIVSLSKAIGGGVPLGAMVSTDAVMDWPQGAHANTFGGNLLACAGGIAALEYMKRKKLGDNAVRIGKIIMKGLESMKGDAIVDVRGLGLMIGVEICDRVERDRIVRKAMEDGLLLLPAGESVVRISPPLTLTKGEAEKGLAILEGCL
ncbi:MAG: aminotransferase class III-fold pyridoxal phosphate-dependent enzyme [Candidatus ainarchaeum sp.]|nr:aminotransferase class III-fold pyridoxal phosphate-dependent enzyme [Candidatus ainarchaeum sp.]